MTTRLIGLYSVALGLAVAGLWAAILVSGDLPEGRRALAFHLLSEALMALGVMIGGALLLKGHRTGAGIAAAAHAMVVYSTLNAAGYYLQRGGGGRLRGDGSARDPVGVARRPAARQVV